MTLPLWVAFQGSHELKCWFCDEEQDWIQLGEVLRLQKLPMPIVFSVPKAQLGITLMRLDQKKWQSYLDSACSFSFILKRDDSTLLPVYESGTASIKIMSIFSEFADSVAELSKMLCLSFVSFQDSNQPGAFELKSHFATCSNLGEVLRVLGLLRAGTEILSLTRGFQVVDFRWGDLSVSGNLLAVLQEQLCS